MAAASAVAPPAAAAASGARLLRPEDLRLACDPATLPFGSTAELEPLGEPIGQDRAVAAIAFGVAMRSPGYNLFVVGAPATGRTSTLRALLARRAAAEPVPPDQCYVYGFDDPYLPAALALPAGRGRELRDDMVRFIEQLAERLPRAFESEDFARREALVAAELARAQKLALDPLEQAARDEGFVLVTAPEGIAVVAAPRGEPLQPEQLAALPAEERAALEARGRALEERLEAAVRQLRHHERDAEAAGERLVADVAEVVAAELLREPRRRFQTPAGDGSDGFAAVQQYFDRVQADVVRHAGALRSLLSADGDDDSDGDGDEGSGGGDGAPDSLDELDGATNRRFLDRYRVNLLVDRSGASGAPVVVEYHPTPTSLVGRREHRVRLGALFTDHTLIRPGALHRADGGYLLLSVEQLVRDERAWEVLKHVLRTGTVTLPESEEASAAVGLQPAPMAVRAKIVLIGTPESWEALEAADEELRELFKVRVEFDDTMERTAAAAVHYGQFVAGACRAEPLPHFDRTAVARLVDEGARRAESQTRVSSRMGELLDLVREAGFFAAARGATLVAAADLDRAVAARRHRAALDHERLARQLAGGELRLDVHGAAVGQVNGMAVFERGEHAFGMPVRITARTFAGRPGVIDIEREAELAGPIHSKGVLILAGFLAGRWARTRPLAVAATLAFEQSYGLVEGDSASLAELCALLSSLARLPLAQGLALTGAVDQLGNVQAVGGVDDKIEGFFDACRVLDAAMPATSGGGPATQGVILPATNARHLMLRPDVVRAVAEGRFQVWAVDHVDQAMALLTGLPAGTPDAGGGYPPDTVNGAIERAVAESLAGVRTAGVHLPDA